MKRFLFRKLPTQFFKETEFQRETSNAGFEREPANFYIALFKAKRTQKHITKLSGKKSKSKYRTRSRGQARCSVFPKLVCFLATCFLHTNKSASWHRKSLQKPPNFVINSEALHYSLPISSSWAKPLLRCVRNPDADDTTEKQLRRQWKPPTLDTALYILDLIDFSHNLNQLLVQPITSSDS